MNNIRFYDINFPAGSPTTGAYKPALTQNDILFQLKKQGIDKALVSHAAQSEAGPPVGNRLLTDIIKGRDELGGTWSVLPPQSDEQDLRNIFYRNAQKLFGEKL